MILHLCVCLSLCQCLAYGFVNSNSNLDFLESSTLKRYVSFCWFSLLAASGRAAHLVYVWLWADFLNFLFFFLFSELILSFCVGALH